MLGISQAAGQKGEKEGARESDDPRAKKSKKREKENHATSLIKDRFCIFDPEGGA